MASVSLFAAFAKTPNCWSIELQPAFPVKALVQIPKFFLLDEPPAGCIIQPE
jgi:hypothetical protein